ncbi:MAG: biotin/lipoyl-binding protein [Rikenellaceae bacterium]|nr:biotin/lipoyl-binding protein [Rikenellaceae bacterium]
MKDYKLKIHGQEFNVRVENINDASTEATVNVNGVEYLVEIEGAKPVKVSKPQVTRIPENAPNNPTPATATPSKPAAVSASGTKIACPLPGTVLSIKVKVGDTVSAGQNLMVLEAMKMENNIDSTTSGTVKEICVQAGASVMEGDTLIVIG